MLFTACSSQVWPGMLLSQSSGFGASHQESHRHSEICHILSPLPTDCYLAFPKEAGCSSGEGMSVPAGRNTWKQWKKMEDAVLAAAFALCENEPINSAPLPFPFLPLPRPSSPCLLSLFVSEMIPSVMSKATLSYSCCRGNQHRERPRLKLLQRLKWVNKKGYLWCFMRNGILLFSRGSSCIVSPCLLFLGNW